MKFPHSTFKIVSSRLSVLLICVAALTSWSMAQGLSVDNYSAKTSEITVPQLAPTPTILNGVVNCADLDANDGSYPSIVDNRELKLDFATPNGTFQFRTYTTNRREVILIGEPPVMPPAYRNITVASSGDTLTSFSTLQAPTSPLIYAVILKVGNISYVYYYPNGTTGDTNLDANNQNSISHISFCFGTSLAPSAAPATISGRVVNTDGQGISGSRVSVLDPTSGATMEVRTNPFGYYTFDALPAGNLYIISVIDKRYTFNDNVRSITLNEDLADMDFVANPE